MRPKSTAGLVAGLPSPDLQLERLPNGEWAWLRPEVETPDPDEPIPYVLTQRGRDEVARRRAMQWLFGRPWPTVAEASALGEVA